MPEDETVVETAAQAAEAAVFEEYSRSELADVDISVTFEDGSLSIEVYIEARTNGEREQEVADAAALAGQRAADELFEHVEE